MILLDNTSTGFVNFDTAARYVDVTMPDDPTAHKIIVRVAMTLNNLALRTFHVILSNSGTSQFLSEFYIQVDSTASEAAENHFFEIGPLITSGVTTLRVSVEGDGSGDTNESMEAFLYSDDPEYYETYRAAEASPTANSRTERLKAVDDKLEGITSLAEWLGAMAGAHSEDTTSQTEIQATGGGGGSFTASAYSQEAIRNRGDAAWITATGFATAAVLGALNDAAAAGDPTSTDTLMQYVKQLVNILAGAAGIATWPAEQAPGNARNFAEILRAIHTDVTGVAGSTPAIAGDQMTLADDAITEDKFDGVTAYPITATDTGTTRIARTGADSDTLETLSDEIAVVDGIVDSILVDTGTTLPAEHAALPTAAEIAALIGPNVHGADCYYVDSDRADDTGDGLTWATAKKTIGAAVSAASSGDTVIVGPGAYTETSTITIAAGESLRFIGAGEGITSLNNAVANQTIDVLGVLEIHGMEVTRDPENGPAVRTNHANARVRAYNCRLGGGDTEEGLRVNAGGEAIIDGCYIEGLQDSVVVEATTHVLISNGIIQGAYDGVLCNAGHTLVSGVLLDHDSYDLRNSGSAVIYASGCGYAATLGTVNDDAAEILVDTGTTLPAAIAAIQADLPNTITKNTALADFPFFMVLSSDHVTGATGKTVTAQRSLDGGAFSNAANAVVEISSGVYKIDLAASDLNADTVMLKFTETDCDARLISIVTKPT